MPTKPERPVSTIRTSQSVPRPTSYSPPSLWVEMSAATGSVRATTTAEREAPAAPQALARPGARTSEATMRRETVMATTFVYVSATEATHEADERTVARTADLDREGQAPPAG